MLARSCQGTWRLLRTAHRSTSNSTMRSRVLWLPFLRRGNTQSSTFDLITCDPFRLTVRYAVLLLKDSEVDENRNKKKMFKVAESAPASKSSSFTLEFFPIFPGERMVAFTPRGLSRQPVLSRGHRIEDHSSRALVMTGR